MVNQLNLNQHVLALLAKSNNLSHLKQLQAYLIALGHSQTQFYGFKLVRFCTLTLANFRYARLIFDHLNSPNIYLYTAMITAYVSRPDHVSAFVLYRNMVRRRNPLPNQFIFPHVLKSCPEVMESRGTDSVHAEILKWGFELYPVVQTALVDSYSRILGDVGKARKVFDEMLERNVVSWTAMVSGYTRVGDIDNAMKLFDEMPERDVPSWNALIAGCTQNGFFSEAIKLFRKMVILAMEKQYQCNDKPNQITVVCALSACGHTGMLQLGKWIHTYLYKNGFILDSYTSNALVDMYGKCGNLKEARKVFYMNPDKGLTSWNSMINSFAIHGQSDSAIAIFGQMMEHGDNVRPDEVTFIGLLNACTHGGLVEKGYCYFEMMIQEYGIEPRIDHYGCLIDLLCRAGRLDEAIEVVRDMSMEPDEVIWGSLLNGCRVYGRTDLAELAAKKLVEIDPDNGGYGTMLANIYAELGKWDEVQNLRRFLKERKSHKIPGCSWIEVDDQVHQFYSFDKSNPDTEEICSVLESLIGFRNEVMVEL